MNEETAKRRELARRVADAFQRKLNASAAIVVGSTARGLTDPYSDIDMTIFFTELPSRDELAEVRDELDISDCRKLSEGDESGFAETFMIDGIECQVGYCTLASLEEIIDDVLIRNDTDHDKHTIMGGLSEALPLYGADIVDGWKERIAVYPPDLARAMVRAHLDFRPAWFFRERIAGRDTLIVFHTLIVDMARKLLGVHLGLNRVYPEHDFKRAGRLTERFQVAPADLDRRLRTILSSEYEPAIQGVMELITETFALVEHHMPELDTTEARTKFSRPDPIAGRIAEDAAAVPATGA